MTTIALDLRHAVRLTRRQPAFAAGIVAMLALGIGATTALFSVVHGVLLKPLVFPEPDRLVEIFGAIPERNLNTITLTEANFWDLRDMNRAFEEVGARHGASFSLTGVDAPERLRGAQVSAGFFRTLGIRPVVGRLFERGDDEPGADARRVLLANGLWTRRFGRDPDIVGRTITLDGLPYLVIGVLPPGSPWLDGADAFVPFIRRADADRESWEYTAIGRLKPGVTFAAALDDLRRVARELEARHRENKGLTAAMQPSQTWIASDQLRQTLWILLGAVGLLLVIASVNVTNLLLVRASARVRETAVRTALGASRADLVRERLIESLLYSTMATVGGWLVASWMLGLLKGIDPGTIPRLNEVALNGISLAFSAAVAVAVGVVTGVVPVMWAPRTDVVPVLRNGLRGSTADRGQSRLRAAFVAAEVALSVILLVGAGLLVRSLAGVLSADRGFQAEDRMMATVSIPRSYGEARVNQITTDIMSNLQRLPEVTTVAAVSMRPMARGSTGLGIVAADRPDALGAAVPWATWRIVSVDYFKAMGLPLLAGRGFGETEEIGKPWRVVISQRVANLLWPGRDPIGQSALLWRGQGDRRAEVIGVVGDMRERGLETDPTLAVYFPAHQSAASTLQLVIHTKGNPENSVPAVRAIVGNIDRTLPVSDIRTLDEIVTASIATRRLTMALLATFAGLALLLALAGVYGVLAYSISRRTFEFGIRVALGAEHRAVLRLVFAQGMRPVVVGILLGLGTMLWLSRLMTSLLFNVTPRDPVTYATVVPSLIVVAALACYIPARRVLAVDPATALRIE
jgi:putative ABC transport system permease protein